MVKRNQGIGIAIVAFGLIAFAGLGGLGRTREFVNSFREEESSDTDPITTDQQGSSETEQSELPQDTNKDPSNGGIQTFVFNGAAGGSTRSFDPLSAFRGLTFDPATVGIQQEPAVNPTGFRTNTGISRDSGRTRTIGRATEAGRQSAIRQAARRPATNSQRTSSNSRTGSVTQDIIENLRAGRPIVRSTRSSDTTRQSGIGLATIKNAPSGFRRSVFAR